MKIVRKEECGVIAIGDCNECKIYAVFVNGVIYKLHKIAGQWMFCGLNSSVYGSSGVHNSMTQEISIQVNSDWNKPVYQFDNQAEFIKWCAEQLKSYEYSCK